MRSNKIRSFTALTMYQSLYAISLWMIFLQYNCQITREQGDWFWYFKVLILESLDLQKSVFKVSIDPWISQKCSRGQFGFWKDASYLSQYWCLLHCCKEWYELELRWCFIPLRFCSACVHYWSLLKLWEGFAGQDINQVILIFCTNEVSCQTFEGFIVDCTRPYIHCKCDDL